VLRVVAHLAAWLPFILGPVRMISRGWRPVGDEAAIALRSYAALTSAGPMVGQATRLARGVFDPGPLEYWLLSVPVHINPVYGQIAGAGLCCMAACSLAIEAAWAVRGELAGLAASALILGLVLWEPGIALLPGWNPWFGMVFSIASIGAGWAVIAGHRRWWPVLVITASIAAQAHLMFALSAVALVVLALFAGIADSVRARAGYWWAAAGALAGAVCWSAPLIQQFTRPHGNLGALIRSTGRHGPGTGGPFALKTLTAAVQPVPLWWKPPITEAAILREISGRPAAFAVAALILLAAAGVTAAWPLRSRWLAALAGVTLVLSLAALVTYASIPLRNNGLSTLTYLITLAFPAGVLTWLAVGSAAVLAIRRAVPRLASVAGPRQSGEPVPAAIATALTGDQAGQAGETTAPAGDPAAPAGEPAPAGETTAPAAPVAPGGPAAPADGWQARLARARTPAWIAAAVVIAALAVLALRPQPARAREVTADPAMWATKVAAAQIEHALPSQPIALTIKDAHSKRVRRRLTLGLTWALTPRGYHPEITRSKLARELGGWYVFHGQRIPLTTVFVRHHGIHVDVSRRSGRGGRARSTLAARHQRRQ
jgi:hypothetical protein